MADINNETGTGELCFASEFAVSQSKLFTALGLYSDLLLQLGVLS